MSARIFAVELTDDLRAMVREPAALFFGIIMPVAMFVVFVSVFGRQSVDGVRAGTTMLATFGAYGVLAVTFMSPGLGVATDRESGWLRTKRVAAVPIRLTLVAKVAAAIPYAVGVFAAMVAAAALTGSLDATPGQLVRLGAVLVLGSFPFTLLGLAVGFQASTNAAAAILNAFLMPCALVSGLWMPLHVLPAFFADIAVFLPTYHLSELAKAQAGGGGAAGSALVLAGMTAAAAVVAGVSYRRAKL